MAKDKRKFGGPRFLALGGIYWMVVAALIGLAHKLWPAASESTPIVAVTVFVVVVVGFGLVFLFRPK